MKNPYSAYRNQPLAGKTRIETILELYDALIARIEKCLTELERNAVSESLQLRVDAQMIVTGLAAGLDLDQGEIPNRMLRLYEFIADCLRVGGPEKLKAALGVARTLQEAFLGIRSEAVQLERSGSIPGVEASHLLCAQA